LSDEEWALIRQLLPPQKPRTGRPALDHRTIINAILWVKCNGYPWRDLPARYGKWSTAACRYHRWTQAGIWNDIAAVLARNAHANHRRQTFYFFPP
jgi:transposase